MNKLNSPKLWIPLILVLGGAYAGWNFWNSISTQKPDQQELVERRDMPDHYVELWTEPDPPLAGRTTRVIVRIKFKFLMGGRVDDLRMRFRGPDGRRLDPDVRFTTEEPGRGEIYTTRVRFPVPGAWTLEVPVRDQGVQNVVSFSLPVRR